MSIINILDKNTVNQIAAGEVVERPSSVVKELVENSIDAGATAVTCEIKGGGIDLIRITDNGMGIDESDIRTAFLRHATSKIKDASDLENVLSLGFRGEALASIAAVAEVELLTKTRDSLTGFRYCIEGGEETAFESVGCPDGTTFIIRNLFKNVPVRRKFLKSVNAEAAYISELVERIALSHPEVSIKFINNGRTTIFTSGSNSVKDIIYGIYGREITSQLVEISGFREAQNQSSIIFNSESSGTSVLTGGTDEAITVTGFIAKPVVARSNRNLEHYYVNGRYIRSNIISKAIEDAFAPYMMQHKYPFTALHIHIPASAMDVNVHPAKHEVRFERPDTVYNVVFQAVGSSLRKALLVPEVRDDNGGTQKAAREAILRDAAKQMAPEPFENRRKQEIFTGRQETSVGRQETYTGRQETTVAPANDDVKDIARSRLADTSFVRDEEMVQTGYAVSHYVMQSDAGLVHDSALHGTDEARSAEISNSVNTPIAHTPDASKTESASPNSGNKQAENVSYEQLVFETNPDKETGEIRPETEEEFRTGLNDGYKIVGQVFNTYWIVERGREMYIIDQHAAHEKIIYERLVNDNSAMKVASQQLSPSVIISLSAFECELVEEHIDELISLGFTLESFGGREYSVSSVPMQLYSLDAIDLLMEIIESFSESRSAKQTITLKERLATCACKAAVKGNTRISEAEARALIEQLLTLDNPFNCPHGRPVIVSMTKPELEKKFKRIV